MATKVFINLPVKDLEKSMSFFSNLGYQFDDHITDELAACLIISDNIFVMLLQEEYFKTFTKKYVGDNRTFSEVLISLDAESKQAIQDIITKARQLGAHIYAEPEDHGWMYQHSLADLDGHLWEYIYVDKNSIPDSE
jgi:uncharacterized protein